MLHRIGLLLLAGLLIGSLHGQPFQQLSLSEAYELLEARYPLLQNAGLQEQVYQTKVKQLEIARLPSLHLKADGRLQSQSTQLKAEDAMLPFEINQPLVGLKSYLEANYLLLDGGLQKAQQKILNTQLQADLQQFSVTRYALRERINQLFLGISLISAQSDLFDLSLQDLRNRAEVVAAGVEYGTVLESEGAKLAVKKLLLQSQIDDLIFQEAGIRNSLSDLLGVSLSDSITLIYPVLGNPEEVPNLARPEQKLFQLQSEALMAQTELLAVDRQPKVSLFAQAGVGYPNPLNILDNSTAPYGIIGAGFSWKLVDWNKQKLAQEQLRLQALQIQNQKATFEFNLDSKTARYLAQVRALQQQIQGDQEITQLQTEILTQMAAQLDEGVINTSEYLIQLNEELAARQRLVLHKIELQQVQLAFWNERGADF